MMEFNPSKGRGAGGPIYPIEPAGSARPDLGSPSEIVSISDDSKSWLLDGRTGRIVADDPTGRRVVIGKIASGRPINGACVSGRQTIAFVDVGGSNRIGQWHLGIHQIGSVAISPRNGPPFRTDDALQLSGAASSPCAVWSHTSRLVLVLDSGQTRADIQVRTDSPKLGGLAWSWSKWWNASPEWVTGFWRSCREGTVRTFRASRSREVSGVPKAISMTLVCWATLLVLTVSSPVDHRCFVRNSRRILWCCG